MLRSTSISAFAFVSTTCDPSRFPLGPSTPSVQLDTWAVHSKEHGPCPSKRRFDGSPRLSLPFSARRSCLSASTPHGEHHLDVPVSKNRRFCPLLLG